MRSRIARVIALVAAVALLADGPASAAPSPPVKRRREAAARFSAANELFQAGQYAEALAQLEAGYALEPRPEFLVAFAQTYREMGRVDEALEQCQRYLAVAGAGPLAPQVRELARALRRERPRRPAAAKVVPPTVAEPEPEPARLALSRPVLEATGPVPAPAPATAPAPAPAPGPVAVTSTPALAPSELGLGAAARRDDRVRRRRLVLGLVLGATGIAVGVGLGLGLGLGLDRAPPPTQLGSVSFR